MDRCDTPGKTGHQGSEEWVWTVSTIGAGRESLLTKAFDLRISWFCETDDGLQVVEEFYAEGIGRVGTGFSPYIIQQNLRSLGPEVCSSHLAPAKDRT